MILAQATDTIQAVKAAQELWGPAGVIIALCILAMLSYLLYEVRSLRNDRAKSVDARLEDAQEQIEIERAHKEEIRELERETLGTLRDVTELLDKLEESDRRLSESIRSVETTVLDRLNDVHTSLRDQ